MTIQPPAWTSFDADSPPSLPAGRGHVVAVVASGDVGDRGPELAVGLARAWARAGHRVVLADLDLDGPRLHLEVGVENRDGVTDAVAFGASVGRVAQAVPGDPFFFIGAGTAVADPASLLDHPRWGALCRGFQEAEATLVAFVPEDGAARAAVLEQATHVIVVAPEEAGARIPEGVDAGRVLAVTGLPEVVDLAALAPDSEDADATDTGSQEAVPDVSDLAPETDEPEERPASEEAELGVAGAAGVAVTEAADDPGADEPASDDPPGEVVDIGALAPAEAGPPTREHQGVPDDGPAPEDEPVPADDLAPDVGQEEPALEWEDPERPTGDPVDAEATPGRQGDAVGPDLHDLAAVPAASAADDTDPAFTLEPEEASGPEAEPDFALEPETVPEAEPDFALEPEPAPTPEEATEPEPEAEPEPEHPPVPLADEILAEAGDAPEPAVQMGEGPRPEGPEGPPSSGGRRSFLLWLLLGLLVTVGALWWFGYVEVPGITSPNAVGTAEPVAAPSDLNAAEPRTETSPPAAWAVAVEAHEDRQTAWNRAAAMAAEHPDRLWVTAPVAVDGTLYHRVLVGTEPDSAAAAMLRDEVAGDLGVDPGSLVLRSTPLAFRLGETRTLEAARRRAGALRELDIPAYVLRISYSDGEERFRVYGGAFARGEEAQALDSLLAEVGMPREELIERTGHRPE